MFCYNCGCHLSEHDYCTSCGADVALYKRIMILSNLFYNEGLARAGLRDLTGAVTSLRQSLKFNKNNIEARNLLGLVYFEMGETVGALSEWVISKNTRPEKNIADDYINMIQASASRLDSINQTIKKYNQALVYCRQDSKDLAVIQLRKVLSLNPKFIRAHQLLALLYMDSEQWDKAKRELVKCADMDRNNIQTLTYMREVDRMLAPDETGKISRRKDREEAVRYQTENEVLIQPKGVKEPRRSGVGTLLNIMLGLVIGVAVMYFLVVPSVRTNVLNESRQKINEISNESDAKNNMISDLENQIKEIEQETARLQGELGREPGLEEIARETGIEPEDIVMAMESETRVESIYSSVYQDDGSEIYLMDKVAAGPGGCGSVSPGSQDPEKESLINHLLLQQLLSTLKEQERQLIVLRYYRNHTQTEVASILGISQVQVSRLEKKILLHMRQLAVE